MHPMPSEADIRWRQNPRLPLEQHKKQIKMANKTTKSANNGANKEINKTKEPKGKRLPRNIRLERLYAGSPASFESEFIDTSFSRRSDFDSNYNRSPPPRSVDDYVIHTHVHPHSQNQVCIKKNRIRVIIEFFFQKQQTLLEQISFAEDVDVDDDPIEAYVLQQHRKILKSSQNRSSTPIQQQQNLNMNARPLSQATSPSYSKSHATIV